MQNLGGFHKCWCGPCCGLGANQMTLYNFSVSSVCVHIVLFSFQTKRCATSRDYGQCCHWSAAVMEESRVPMTDSRRVGHFFYIICFYHSRQGKGAFKQSGWKQLILVVLLLLSDLCSPSRPIMHSPVVNGSPFSSNMCCPPYTWFHTTNELQQTADSRTEISSPDRSPYGPLFQ